MRILVDADACPVKGIIEDIAESQGIEVYFFANYCHDIASRCGRIIKVDKQSQSVDIAISNFAMTGDIVVTQDYGLASVALAKRAAAIGNNGLIYTDQNIDSLLMQRHAALMHKKGGGRLHQPAKRSKQDDLNFKNNLYILIEKWRNNNE